MPPRTRKIANDTNRPSPLNPKTSKVPSRRKVKMKQTTGNQFTELTPRPVYRSTDNAKSLLQIRTALGPQRLWRLPTIHKFSLSPVKPDASFDWLPLSVHIGYYIPPDEKSPHVLLSIYANVNDRTRGHPYLHINGVAEEEFGDIVARDFQGYNVDWLDFFQKWEVFVEHVHFCPCLVAMNSWEELQAQVCYCYLLAWEAKILKIFWYRIPTSSKMADILISLCTDKEDQGAGGADDSVERSSPGVGSAEAPHLPERKTPEANLSIQNKGFKRSLAEPTTLSASERQPMQRKVAPPPSLESSPRSEMSRYKVTGLPPPIHQSY